MRNSDPGKSFTFFSRTGCLLPQLIILNFFFGWIIFGFRLWLFIEIILVFFFLLSAFVVTKKIFPADFKTNSASHADKVNQPGDNKIVDIEGEVLSDNNNLSGK